MAAKTTVPLPRLVELRTKAGLTQAKLAERSGVHRVSVADIERGRPASLATVDKLAMALECKPTDLIGTPVVSVPRHQLHCSECGRPFAASTSAPAQGKVFCRECMTKHLRSNIQWDLLEDYAQFGCRNRSATAAMFGNLFLEHPNEVQLRKYAALKAFEELILATEDLCMLYFALRDRVEKPPLETLLTFNVDPKHSRRWHDELAKSDTDVLQRLGLLDSSGKLLGAWKNQALQVAALLTAIDGMRDAANDRVVAAGALVQALNKLKHGFVATSRKEFIEPPERANELVAILSLDRELGRLNRLVVEATDEKINQLVETVASRADAAQCLLMSFIKIYRR